MDQIAIKQQHAKLRLEEFWSFIAATSSSSQRDHESPTDDTKPGPNRSLPLLQASGKPLRIFSGVDFSKFKCFDCENYLSVPPILIYTNLNGENLNLCGRCEVPEEGQSVRNEAFEALAKCLDFPCSLNKKCSTKITWGEAEKHESVCIYRTVFSNMCDGTDGVCGADSVWHLRRSKLKFHFKNLHPEQYILNEKLIINERIITGSVQLTYLIDLQSRLYLVHITSVKEKADELAFQVEAASSWIPRSFNISFIKKDKIISFKNMLARDEYGWKYHDVNIKSIRRALNILLPNCITTPFKMEVEICEEDTVVPHKNDVSNNNKSIIYFDSEYYIPYFDPRY